MSPNSYRIALVLAGSVLLGLSVTCNDARADYESWTDSSDANVDADAGRCHRYDALQPQGTTNPSISTCETLSPGIGGLRDKLADNGWMVQGGTFLGGTFDLLDHGARPQLYIDKILLIERIRSSMPPTIYPD